MKFFLQFVWYGMGFLAFVFGVAVWAADQKRRLLGSSFPFENTGSRNLVALCAVWVASAVPVVRSH